MTIIQIRNKYYMLMKYHPALIAKEKQHVLMKKALETNELLEFLEKLISNK